MGSEDKSTRSFEVPKQADELSNESSSFKGAEEDVAKNRDKYRTLFNSSSLGCLTLSESGRICEANTAVQRLLGVKPKELTGRLLASFLNKGDARKLDQHLHHVLTRGGQHTCELTFDLRSSNADRLVHVRLDSVSFIDSSKSGPRVLSTVYDLTVLRRAETERRSSEAQMSAILDTTTDAVINSDASDAIESFNASAERIFGYKASEVIGCNIRMLLPNLDRDNCFQTVQRYSASGEPRVRILGAQDKHVFGRRKDGTHFPLELNLGQWWDGGKRKFTTVVRDATEVMQAEARVLQNERYFRRLADRLDDVLAVMERQDGRVVYANQAFEKIWGRSVSDLENDPTAWRSWIHPEDRDRVERAYAGFIEGNPFEEEFRIRWPNGHVRWLQMRAFLIHEGDGATPLDFFLMKDITGVVDREEELRQAQKLEALGALASGVAHDFGNVLQAALGCVNLAREGGTSLRSADEYLARAQRAIRQGAELTEQLMEFVRKRQAEPRTIELDATVKSASKLLEHLVTEQIRIQIATGAPGAKVFADPIQIEQILMNLAANARDAMPGGGILMIETRSLESGDVQAMNHGCSADREYVRLTVRDSGRGMDPQIQQRMFEPFFTTSQGGKGTGLGLSTVLGVTRRVGGQIHVESEPNQGTTFTLYFPLQEAAPAPASSERRRMPHFSGTALLVENEPEVRITVRHFLESLGLGVIEASDAVEAQVLFERSEQTIDILISDLVLPAFPGTRLALLLRRKAPDLPVLLVSANPEALEKSRDVVENSELLKKPFDKEELSEKLQELLVPLFSGSFESSSSFESKTQLRAGTRLPVPDESRVNGKTIVIVEDERYAREALEDILAEEGYRVFSTDLPSDALRLVENGTQVDLLLSDLRLPEMQGDQLANKVRNLLPNIEVIFMSGRFVPAGANGTFVQKPVDLDRLLEIIRHRLTVAAEHSA